MSSKEWICCICLDDKEDNCYVLSPCQHKFHTKCLINSLRRCGPRCPLCRGTETENSSIEREEYIRVNRYNTGWVSNLDSSFNDTNWSDISSIESSDNSINILDLDSTIDLEIDYSLDDISFNDVNLISD